MDLVKFWTVCSANSIILTEPKIRQFERYEKELIYWNEKINLISRKDEENILERHFLHSLSILKYVNFKEKGVCLDFGTGAGFPGIPIKIARPDLYFLLIDSMKKKLKIAEMFAQHTGLRNIEATTCRIEEFANQKSNFMQCDYIMARAVTKLDTLVEWTIRLLKENGKMIFLKGGDLTEEISNTKRKFPSIKIEEIEINLFGAEWFLQENKKIIVCSF